MSDLARHKVAPPFPPAVLEQAREDLLRAALGVVRQCRYGSAALARTLHSTEAEALDEHIARLSRENAEKGATAKKYRDALLRQAALTQAAMSRIAALDTVRSAASLLLEGPMRLMVGDLLAERPVDDDPDWRARHRAREHWMGLVDALAALVGEQAAEPGCDEPGCQSGHCAGDGDSLPPLTIPGCPVVARSSENDDTRVMALPRKVVVGTNGAYWRYFDPDGVGMTVPWYSMCPVSSDNDPVEPVAVYVREESSGVLPADEPERGNVTLGGRVILIDLPALDNAVTFEPSWDQLWAAFPDAKEIEGPLVNGIIALTFEANERESEADLLVRVRTAFAAILSAGVSSSDPTKKGADDAR